MSANHSLDEVAEALRKHRGLIFPAARALGVSRQAVQQRVKKSAQLQAVLEDSKESLKDITENKLFDAIENGDPWAIQFGLRTFCRDRGYGDRKEISGPEGGPIDVRAVDYRQAVSPMLSDET